MITQMISQMIAQMIAQMSTQMITQMITHIWFFTDDYTALSPVLNDLPHNCCFQKKYPYPVMDISEGDPHPVTPQTDNLDVTKVNAFCLPSHQPGCRP